MVQKTCTIVKERVQDAGYPYDAFEEALANALIHRDYLDTSRGVHVEIKNNCIEISNPGAMMAGNRTVKYLRDKNPARRNPWLYQRILTMVQGRHLINGGSGMSRMKEAFSEIGNVRFINLGSKNLYKVILPR